MNKNKVDILNLLCIITEHMVVRMRVTRSHRNNRRSHHALKEPRLSKCSNCEAVHLRHRMCKECGNYRGRIVIDVIAKTEKRLKKMNEKIGVVHEHEQRDNNEHAKKTETKAEDVETTKSTDVDKDKETKKEK